MNDKQASPDELISTLLDGAPGKNYDFMRSMPDGTRKTVRIRMQLPRVEENLRALQNAQQYAKSREAQGYGDIYREAQAHEILTISLRRPEKMTRGDGTEFYPQWFVDSSQLRASFNETEMAVLLNCLQDCKASFGALVGIEDDDAEGWIAKLSDPLRGPFWLSQLDSLHWPSMIYLLAAVIRDLRSVFELPPATSLDSSESDPENSAEDTGSSSPQPSALPEGETTGKLPANKLLTRDEVSEIIRRRARKQRGEDEE